LCGRQFVTASTVHRVSESELRRSSAAGWENARVTRVRRKRSVGSRTRETRRVRAPIRFFSSVESRMGFTMGVGRGERSSAGGVRRIEGGRCALWERVGKGDRRSDGAGERDRELEGVEGVVRESCGRGRGDGGGVNMEQRAWV
jgi:hypothetical protein